MVLVISWGLIMEVAISLDLKNNPWYFFLLIRSHTLSINSKELKSELDNNLIGVDLPEEGDLALLSFLGQPQHLAFIRQIVL